MKEMKSYKLNGFEYFYDRVEKHWVLYPIDKEDNRIEWDENDKPIEAEYFNNKKELMSKLLNN